MKLFFDGEEVTLQKLKEILDNLEYREGYNEELAVEDITEEGIEFSICGVSWY